MSINHDTLKAALGTAYDPKADYVVCTYAQLHTMQAKGYRQVGEVQDSSPGNQTMLVFDRRPPTPPPVPAPAKKGGAR